MKKNYILIIGFLILIILSLTLFKSNFITGAQTYTQNEKFFYGTYSVNPSFSVTVGYDLNEFNEIIDNAKSIAEECHNKDEVEECVNKKRQEFTNDNLEWKETCFEGTEKIFQEFREFITNCANSADGDCICSYTLPEGKYSFTLDSSSKEPKFKIRVDGIEKDLNIKHSMDLTKDFSPEDKITFLKDPEAKIISEFEESGSKIACTISKEFYTFCVESKYKVLAYDKFRKDTKLRNVEYNFALQIQEKPPAEVKRVHVFDRPKDDTSFILKWDKNKEADVVKYRVYYAKSDDKAFENKNKMRDIKKDKDILKKDFNIEDARDISSSILPGECTFNYEKRKCFWATSKEPIEFNYDDTLFFEGEGFYYVSFNVSEDIEYDFLVTAIDRNGNEIKEIKQDQIEKGTSIDDLPPSSEEIIFTDVNQPSRRDSDFKLPISLKPKPTKNIDDTKLKDLDLAVPYAIYYLKNPEKENKPKPDDSSLLNNFDQMNIDTSHIISNALLLPIGKTSPIPGDKYYIVIVAKDGKGNPKKGQFTAKELGTSVLPLIVTSVDDDSQTDEIELIE